MPDIERETELGPQCEPHAYFAFGVTRFYKNRLRSAALKANDYHDRWPGAAVNGLAKDMQGSQQPAQSWNEQPAPRNPYKRVLAS